METDKTRPECIKDVSGNTIIDKPSFKTISTESDVPTSSSLPITSVPPTESTLPIPPIEAVSPINVEIQDVDSENITMQISGVTSNLLAALRMVIMSQVPTITIDLVEIETNTSPMHDEFLSHRLGLVPLSSHSSIVKEFQDPQTCPCGGEGCFKCTAVFTLDVCCTLGDPLNDKENRRTITSADLVPLNHKVVPCCDPPITLVRLGLGQSIKLRCLAKKGVGREHAKWSPVSNVCFRSNLELCLDKDKMQTQLSIRDREKFVGTCPKQVFAYNKETGSVDIEDATKCIRCKQCHYFLNDMGKSHLLRFVYDYFRFEFSLETTGVTTPIDVFKSAIKCLRERLQIARKAVLETDPNLNRQECR